MKNLLNLSQDENSKYGELTSGYLEIKKSKFYCYIFAAEEEEKVKDKINSIRKDNKKARHVVYAYSFTDKNKVQHSKFSNDNEPQGTGVNSIIAMLEKEEVNNYLVVIVRYFGGILLGAGPLLRSYLNSFKDAYKKIEQKF